jgi:NTP pyrophosphatase (non-canonical NTP hydrolase)
MSRTTLDGYQMRANFTAPMKVSPEIRLATFALGIVGEAGEVADMVKKELGHDHETDRVEMAKELGDVLWYTAALAKLYG